MKETRSQKISKSRPVAARPGRLPLGAKASSYLLAELFYQREDFKKAFQITQKCVDRDRTDFRSQNLMGACLGQMGALDDAEQLFIRVSRMPRLCDLKVRARLNLGLVQLCRDLVKWGDFSVSAKTHATPATIPFQQLGRTALPFETALKTLASLSHVKSPYAHVFHTYISYAKLQFGDLDGALSAVMAALTHSENFYVTHFVLGRILMDLYQLQMDRQGYFLQPETIEFLEIDSSELAERHGDRGAAYPETLLELALQAFLESRELNPYSAAVSLALCHAFLAADLPDEAVEYLNHAENLVGDALPLLDLHLTFAERYGSQEEAIKTIMQRIQRIRKSSDPPDIRLVVPQHFLV